MIDSTIGNSSRSGDAATYARVVDGAMNTLFGLADTSASELLLVRHGEPDIEGANHSDDAPLSEHGLCQAIALAMRLRGTDLDAIYTSNARAARETADALAASRDLTVIQATQLRGITLNPRHLNGSADDLQKLEAEVCLRFINNPRWDSLRGAEPTRMFRHRVVQAIEAIVSRHLQKRVLIVTHQSVINAYLSMVLGIERDMFFQPQFTSISTVRIARDLYAVQSLNDCSHLLPGFAAK